MTRRYLRECSKIIFSSKVCFDKSLERKLRLIAFHSRPVLRDRRLDRETVDLSSRHPVLSFFARSIEYSLPNDQLETPFYSRGFITGKYSAIRRDSRARVESTFSYRSASACNLARARLPLPSRVSMTRRK